MDDEAVKAFNAAKAARKWFECGVEGGRFPTKEDRDRHYRRWHLGL